MTQSDQRATQPAVQDVALIVNKASQTIKLMPVPDPDWHMPARGLVFYELIRKLPPQERQQVLHTLHQ